MADYAQTNSQTENINQWIDQRLCPFINYYQDNQLKLIPIIDYAQAMLPQDSTTLPPIQIELGYVPYMSFDWSQPIIDEPISVYKQFLQDKAIEFTKQMYSAQEIAYNRI